MLIKGATIKGTYLVDHFNIVTNGLYANYDVATGINGFPYFNGYIGAWKIYNRALSALEVNQNFSALRFRFSV